MILSQATHCALVLVCELAYYYKTCWVLIDDICTSNNIPADILKPIANQLCDAKIVECKTGDDGEQWLFLEKEPSAVSVFDIVVLFEGEIFRGRFTDTERGRLLTKSKLSCIINFERNQMLKSIRKRLRGIDIGRWGEMAHNNAYNNY